MLIFFRALLPLLIVSFGGFGLWLMHSTAPQPIKRPHVERFPQVVVQKVQPQTLRIPVYTRGLVSTDAKLVLLAEHGGRVVEVSKNLRPGGHVKRGQLLLRLDDSAIRHDITRVNARLSAARERYRVVDREISAELEVRGLESPQKFLQQKLDQAKNQLAAAKAELALAKLQLEKAKLFAPFDAQIQETFVVVGQQVTPGFRVANLFGRSAKQVRLPLSDRQLRMVETEGLNLSNRPKEDQPRVMLRMHYGDGFYYWHGRLVGMSTQVDPRNRLMYVLAEVDGPLQSKGEHRPQLLVGQLLEAEIQGRTYQNVVVLPRGVLHNNEYLWLVDSQNRLRQKKVSLLYKGKGQVYIHDGLEAGDQIVMSALDIAIEGMKVALSEGESDSKSGQSDESGGPLALEPLAGINSSVRER